jgi:hypothetical protein
MKQNFLSYLGTFSKTFTVSAFIFLISFTLYFDLNNKIFADEITKEKTAFIAFDINYFDQSDLSFSKDIIFQIINFHSMNSNETIILQPYGNKSYSPITIKKEEIEEKLDEFFNNLPKEETSFSNHYLIISQAFTKIAEIGDTSDSNFYIISNLKMTNSEESSLLKLRNLSDLYASSKIKLNVMSLPSSNTKERELFEGFSKNTNGYFIDFDSSSTSSMVNFLNIFMNNPISILQTNLSSKPLSNFINIPPTVSKIRIGIYKENSETNVSIINPEGIEIEPKIDYEYWNLDKILYLDISNPDSGTWTIISSGKSGRLEILTDTLNPLKLETFGQKIFPVGSKIILEVAAYIENERMNIPNAEMQVRIRDNQGRETIQIMNDLGQKNDKTPSNGIYTAELPLINDQSIIDVEYTLQWKNLSTPVIKKDQIKVEYFPEIQITKVFDLSGKEQKEFLVTSFETKVNNYPFLVGLDEIENKLISDNEYLFRIDPVKVKDTHKSYLFNIYLESNEKLKDTVYIDLNLNTTYLDENHKSLTKKIAINVNTNYFYFVGLRYYYWLAIFGVLFIVIIFLVNYLRQTKITGFLTDVQNNVIVDFSTISRNSVVKFIYPKRLNFSDIKQLPYSGGFFEFIDNKVYMEIHPKPDDPNIRINSIPADGRNDISNGPWIGSSGKQVRYKKDIPYLDI